MADVYSLEAQARTVIGKQVKALRRQDLIPAVIYGAGSAPTHISCPRRPLEIVLQKAGGTHVVNVVVEGTTHNALIREVQRDKIRRDILHVDFLRVDLTKTIRTEIPVVFVNAPKLSSEVQLAHYIQQVEVESLPMDIPDHIVVDLSKLSAIGDQVTVGDLPALTNVTYISDPHDVLARVEGMGAAEAEDAAIAAAEPEVVEKGKKEEEDF